MSSYDDLLSAGINLIKQHNSVVGENNPGYVDCDKFTVNLKSLGATSEESLAKIKWEEILQCLSAALSANTVIQPSQLAKDIADIFRGKKEKLESGDKPGYIAPKKVKQMNLRQLVENFDPEESTNAVGVRLKEIVGSNPVIVFNAGSRIVDVDTTFKLAQEIKTGYPARQTVSGEVYAVVDGKPAYPLGYLPENYADENPLYPGRPLRPDGTCDQTNRSWAGVPKEVRQFIRIALDIRDVSVNKVEDAHNLLDLALQSNAMVALQARYGNAKAKYDELQRHNKLPDLLVTLGSPKTVSQQNKRPFDHGVQVQLPWHAVPGANYYGNRNDESSRYSVPGFVHGPQGWFK
jgi:hypothetical protein